MLLDKYRREADQAVWSVLLAATKEVKAVAQAERAEDLRQAINDLQELVRSVQIERDVFTTYWDALSAAINRCTEQVEQLRQRVAAGQNSFARS